MYDIALGDIVSVQAADMVRCDRGEKNFLLVGLSRSGISIPVVKSSQDGQIDIIMPSPCF